MGGEWAKKERKWNECDAGCQIDEHQMTLALASCFIRLTSIKWLLLWPVAGSSTGLPHIASPDCGGWKRQDGYCTNCPFWRCIVWSFSFFLLSYWKVVPKKRKSVFEFLKLMWLDNEKLFVISLPYKKNITPAALLSHYHYLLIFVGGADMSTNISWCNLIHQHKITLIPELYCDYTCHAFNSN